MEEAQGAPYGAIGPTQAAPETLRRKNLRHNYRWAVTDGILAYVGSGMVPPFIAIMALSYGADSIGLSFLNLLPALFNTILFMPFAAIAERGGGIKRLVLISGYATRSAFLLMALVPFMPAAYRAGMLIGLNAVQSIPSVLYLIAWTDMMGGAFPQREWGMVFSKRNAFANFSAVVATLAAGFLIDWLPGGWGYFSVFMISGATGLLSIYSLQQMKEIPSQRKQPRKISPFKRLAMPFADKALGRRFAYFSVGLFLYNLGIFISGPAFSLFYVEELALSKSTISILVTTGTFFVVVGSPFWGWLSKRRSNAVIFAYSTIWQALFPYFYYLSGHSIPQMMAWQAILGIGVAGYNLSMFNLSMEYVDEAERPNGIAATNTVIFAAAALGSLISGPLTKSMGIEAAFLASMIVRLSGWAVFLAVFEPQKIMGKVLRGMESKHHNRDRRDS